MYQTPVPGSVLAFVTTVHLALVVLRAHRAAAVGPISFVTAISVLFAGSPWLLVTPIGLAAGFVAHLIWFVSCEYLLPSAALPVVAAPIAPTPSVVPVRRPAASPPAPPAAKPAVPPSADFVATPVVAVFEEAPDIRTFRMARPDGFDFKAGQFLTVRLRAGGREHVRCYSISSPPGSRGHLEITVKRIGMVSGALHALVRPGALLHVRRPAGAFVYPAGEDRPLVLVAGGVGITPVMSMLRHAIEEEPTRPVTLFYSVRRMEDIAFRDELLMLDKRHQQFRAFIAISDGPAAAEFFPGRINEALITTMAPDVCHAICLLCGPQPMLDAMTALLESIGVPRDQINFEVFQAAVAASARPSTTPGVVRELPPVEPPPAETVSCHTVSFSKSGVNATAADGQKLLELSEDCGASIPSLCRAGVCGTCKTRVLSGTVNCASQILDERDRKDGYVLACVSQIHSDCTIDA